jgi:hypothetical protein
MNFIVEFLPKFGIDAVVYVLRSPNGFPIGTFDTLEEVMEMMKAKFDEMRKSPNGNA